MRRALLALLVACGHPQAPSQQVPWQVPRLLPPAPIDPTALGAGYLTTVAMQLQPGWGQFLDDCRLRLAATHPLNQMALAATALLVIDRSGHLAKLEMATSSGNADFDHAVRDAIADAMPLAPPPVELLSDDDRLHVRWLFARDRRQAGPRTAEVLQIELPLGGVVEHLVGQGELGRAARRIARVAPGPERAMATERVMVAALREALGSADSAVRRAAVDAIARARVVELAGDVRGLLAVTSDAELRVAAMAAVAALGDRDAVTPLLQQLPGDLPEHPRLALAETRALVALGHASDATAAIRGALELHGDPNPVALEAFALAPSPELVPKLATWFDHGDARTRAAVCAALAGVPSDAAWAGIVRGLRDRDAIVRARCSEAAMVRRPATTSATKQQAAARLHELARDRDRGVRARAVAAIMVIDPAHYVVATDDPSTEVRAAYATAIGTSENGSNDPVLHLLIDDREPDVRAAAWTALAEQPNKSGDRAQLALHAMTDPAPQVRLAAVAAVDDDTALSRLSTTDDSPELRAAALVQLAGHRGRVAIGDVLLERIAGGGLGSAERVRISLAWLLAR